MREITQIVEAFESLCAAGKACALATVIGVEGSSYRRPGARMLIAQDGRCWGGISGGCLEQDVARRGRMLIAEPGEPIIQCYETVDDDEENALISQPGPSLGCGGKIEILIERLCAQRSGPMKALAGCLRDRRAARLVTVIGLDPSKFRPGECLIRFEDDGEWHGPLKDAFGPDLPTPCRRAFTTAQGRIDVLVEDVRPPQALVVFGDGHDVAPMVELAKGLAWHVTVVGVRSEAGLRSRFAAADRLVSATSENPASDLIVEPNAAALVMGHHLRRDAAVLANLLRKPPAYVGVLGPRRRTARLLAAAGASANSPHLFAPVGLDIGAESPEQIALSVLAEIQAVFADRGGGFLRNRAGPIHRAAAMNSTCPR